MTPRSNPLNLDPGRACGARVAVRAGAAQVTDLTMRSTACVAAGRAPITIDQYGAQNEATYAVLSGRDDAGVADAPVVAWAVVQGDQLGTLGDVYAVSPYGYAVPRSEPQFAQALAGALKDLIDDGSYQRVLTDWGVQNGAITEPVVNPAVP